MNYYHKHISFFSLLMISSLALTGCESTKKLALASKQGIRIPIKAKGGQMKHSGQDDTQQPSNGVIFTQLNNDENINTEIEAIQSEEFIGSGKFIAKQKKSKITQSSIDGKYSLNFDAADLGEVSKIILSDMLGENYILNPAVKGSITLQTTKSLHKDDLLPTLEMLLETNGAILIKREGLYRIEPNDRGRHTADISLLAKQQLDTGYQIKVIPLDYIGATDMAEVLKPIVPANAIVRIDLPRNLLFVAGSKVELEKIINLVNTFDINYIEGMSFGLYPLKNTAVDSTLTEIQAIFNETAQNPLSGILRFISIKHLNAILVVTPQRAYLKEVKKWIDRLDKQNDMIGEGGVIVYKVQHTDATELATTLNAVISGIAPTKNQSLSIAPGEKVATLTNKTQASKKVAKSSSRSQGNTSLEGVNIIADKSNNALIIIADSQQYRTLSKIIKHLDVMPLQVLIDASIVSVTLEDDLEYGVRWAFDNGLRGRGILGGTFPSALEGIVGAATSGFTYGFLAGDMRIVFNALAKDNKIDVLSSPSLMVLNNEEATITVGDSIPIRTSQSTNTSSSIDPIQTSSIQMLDTGVILKVKPQVNASGQVILEIDQSVNTASETDSSNIDSPTILRRQIATKVAVISGESIVLGGLISETHTYDNTGIPYLKDIPYIGWLFGTISKNIKKNELIVIITPRVVENKFDARKLTEEFKRKLTGIYYDEETLTPNADRVLRDNDGLEIQAK